MTGTIEQVLPVVHRPAGAGERFWGPGDTYRFMVTTEETEGEYFVMEAIVPPGGGPPPHIHRNEAESFYVLEGVCDFHLEDRVFTAGVGDYVHVPRNTIHRFHNGSDALTRLVLTFTPGNIEHFFRDSLRPVLDGEDDAGEPFDAIAARYAANAPRYGMEFLQP